MTRSRYLVILKVPSTMMTILQIDVPLEVVHMSEEYWSKVVHIIN